MRVRCFSKGKQWNCPRGEAAKKGAISKMPMTVIGGKQINYQIHGNGEPLVLLNGIMMSALSWTPFIEVFSKHCQLILLDFIDQGFSDKADEPYTQMLHVDMLDQLFEQLGLKNIHLLGISYGGEIAMQYALKYQSRLKSLILSNTTSYTHHQLKDIGRAWIYAAKTYDGSIFFKNTIPTIYSTVFYEKNIAWLQEREKLFIKAFDQKWYDGYIRLVESAESLNITDQLSQIHIPTLVIGAACDIITPVSCQEAIVREIKDAQFIVIKDCGHASMYEKPKAFAGAVLGFIMTCCDEIKIL
ncbi:MAG: alpha/beta fold hydrolase [Bacillota bacterium]